MARRESNFVEFPGTGMWLILKNDGDIMLVWSLEVASLRNLLRDGVRTYWIDRGMKAATIQSLIEGRRTSAATLLTSAILAKYIKE